MARINRQYGVMALVTLFALSGCGGSDNSAPANVAVPNVVGLTQAAATTAITGAGLKLGTVATASSSTVVSGSVISESPGASTSVASGSPVNLTVSSGPAPVTVPNVVGMTQAAATTAITGAGLNLGTVTMASSATVASGSVISQTPAASTSVVSGSTVNLTVSSGPAQVSVPNVVGLTQTAATTSITGANLIVGTITTASSATVPSGTVISQSPAASTAVAAGSAVNLTVSSGPGGASAGFAYSSNAGDSTLSAYSIDAATGALTPLASSPIAVPGSAQLFEAKVDPSGKYLYVTDDNSAGKVFAFVISQADGSLTAVAGSPFAAGNGSQSLAFDATGSFLYVANFNDNTVSGYSLNASSGALTPLGSSPYSMTGTNPQPSQIASAGNFLYAADFGTNSIQVFAVSPSTGQLTQGVAGSPFALNNSPVSLAIDPAGAVLYAAVIPQTGTPSMSGFTINATTGVLTPVAGNPQAIPVYQYISFDKQGKFLLVPEQNSGTFGLAVYPYNATTGVLGTAVAGSPFATGLNPFSVSVDSTNHFVYTGNDQSANISEFTLNNTTGVLTPIAGSPVAAGKNPDFIAIK